MKEDITIVIPVYNEEKSIEKTITDCRKYNQDAIILVVNDNSNDNTAKIVDNMMKKFKKIELLSHKKNQGYGSALITGFSCSRTPFVAFLDADSTYPPNYVPIMAQIVKNQKIDCCWGNRFGKGINKMPLMRRIGNKALVFFFMVVTGKLVDDVSCGERVFRKTALQKIDFMSLPSGLDMITAMTKRIVKRKLKFKLIPIEYLKRNGKSKLNLIRDFFKMVKNILIEK